MAATSLRVCEPPIDRRSTKVHAPRIDSPIRYATSGDLNIAYKVVGDGPRDLIFIQGSFTNLGVLWEEDRYRSFCQRVARYSRLILFD